MKGGQMSDSPFTHRTPHVSGNLNVRIPQQEGFERLAEFHSSGTDEREVGIVLPVGCGKSGLITLAPFALQSKRALVVAPGIRIYTQLADEFDPSNPEMFYIARGILDGPPFPEPVPLREEKVTVSDLEEAHVVIANIDRFRGGAENTWLKELPNDFFDLILFDEAHHNVADSWETLRAAFPEAKIVNFSATPQRADGQVMAGRILYSFSVFRAIQAGYVKRLKAIVLNPETLKFVRNDGQEVEVSLDDVIRLGEEEADFRRSIVTSDETLGTIADVSIRSLQAIRSDTSDNRHKIIASALNYAHCHQIVEAYRARGLRADFIHTRENQKTERVLEKLERHELDAIVQVRMLGEGFDHPYLSIAAVFSIFRSLSPFVQFVGRIMRSIEPNNPTSPLNQGRVIFHAGANIARRWTDFQQFTEADQEYFDQLLPIEGLDFSDATELELEPDGRGWEGPDVEIRDQTDVRLQELELIADGPAAEALAEQLQQMAADAGFQLQGKLQPIPKTKFREKQARHQGLDERVKTEAGRLLAKHDANPGHRDLDTNHLGRDNFVVVKTAIDRRIRSHVDKRRPDLSAADLDAIDTAFSEILTKAEEEVFGAGTA
jgi:superfamily II DNA or RNA helicase